MKHKSLKHRIRARQKKTGESYSIARMHILANLPQGLLLGPNGACAPAPWKWNLEADALLALDEHARNTWKALPCSECNTTTLAFEATQAPEAQEAEVHCKDCGATLGAIITPLERGIAAHRKGAFGPAEAANLPLLQALLSWEEHHKSGRPLALPQADWSLPDTFTKEFLERLKRAFRDETWTLCDFPGQEPKDPEGAPPARVLNAAQELLEACPSWEDLNALDDALQFQVQHWIDDLLRSHIHHHETNTPALLKLAHTFAAIGTGPNPQYLLALVHAKAGDKEAALAVFDTFPEYAEPFKSRIDTERARTYIMLKDEKAAEALLQELLERQLPAFEDYSEPKAVLCRLLQSQGRTEEAQHIERAPPPGMRPGIPLTQNYTCPDAPRLAYTGHHKQCRRRKKVGRNKPCPCGSKKKYKRCCGS